MGIDPRNAASEKNWKLRAELEAADRRGALEDMVGFLRRPAASEEAKALEADVPKHVVITHDGGFEPGVTAAYCLRSRGSDLLPYWDE